MKNLKHLKKSSIVQHFIEVGFLIFLKKYVFAQLIFSRFIFAIAQYVLITYKAFVLGKEESSLQNYCKMINQYNLSFLPMEKLFKPTLSKDFDILC